MGYRRSHVDGQSTGGWGRVTRVSHARDAAAYERVRRQLEPPMFVLALLFVPILAFPHVAETTETQRLALEAASWFIWAAFLFEYLLLLYLAPDRRRMVRTHVLDLVIIVLPFLRPLRALRILQAGAGMARASVALRRITTRPGFRGFLLIASGTVVASAVAVTAFERQVEDSNISSFADALWWAFVTATTVGYGDHFPVSPQARAMAMVLMLVGIGVFSVVTANIAAFFVETSDTEAQSVSLDDLDQRLARIEALLSGPSAAIDLRADAALLRAEVTQASADNPGI